MNTATALPTITSIAALLLAAILAAPAAEAREVYRCRAASGAVAYQDAPCGAASSDSQLLVLSDHPLDAPSQQTARVARQAAEYADLDRRRAQELDAQVRAELPRSLGGHSDVQPAKSRHASQARAKAVRAPAASACEKARAKRDLAYREHGNTMNFDARRRLQDHLISVCGL